MTQIIFFIFYTIAMMVFWSMLSRTKRELIELHEDRIRKAELRIGALYRKCFDLKYRVDNLEGLDPDPNYLGYRGKKKYVKLEVGVDKDES